METLTIQHIAPYLPYGLEVMSKKHFVKYGKELPLKVNGIAYGDTEDQPDWQYEFIVNDDLRFAPINDKRFKPILYPISCLTKPITHNNETFIPLLELAKIAFPEYDWTYNANVGECKNPLNEYFGMDSKGNFYISDRFGATVRQINHQYQLFQKLAEWGINFNGIPEHLYINKETIKN